MVDLITLEEYKTYASISSTEYNDKLNLVIKSVSSLVRAYCARKLISEEPEVDYYNGGINSIYTKEFPIISVTSLERSIDYGQTYATLVEFVDYVVDKQKDQLYLITEDLIESPNKYKLTYTGGYLEVPEDLKLAILDLVDYYYKNETVPKRMSNFVTIEYVKTTDFPPHIKRVLDLYRVV